MKFDPGIFIDQVFELYGRGTDIQENGLDFLIRKINEDEALTCIGWPAYMLATVKHETANTFQPISERGSREHYFLKYEPNMALGHYLGNTEPGDGYKYRGRGFVQITGRPNYRRLNDLLGLHGEDDIYEYPDQAMRRDIAYRIMSEGMRTGAFTGRKLGDFIDNEIQDYYSARKIINGLDAADRITTYAKAFDGILKRSEIK